MGLSRGYDTTGMINALAAEILDDDVEIIKDADEGAEPQEPTPIPPVIDEPAEVKEPEAEPEKKEDESASIKDQLDLLNNRLEFLQESTARSRQDEPASVPDAPKSFKEITDLDEYSARMEAMEQRANAAYKAIRAIEVSAAQKALTELKEQYPDIEQFIPKDQLERGIDMRIESGNYGSDWKAPFLQVYDYATGGKRHQSEASRVKELEAELSKLKDEVAQKRAKRDELRSAGQVPAGGGTYQRPAAPSPQEKGVGRGYKQAARAFEEALAQLGG